MLKKTPRSKLMYNIVRIYLYDNNERVLRNGVTFKHAREHCCNPESAYTTCKKPVNKHRTIQRGPWFDVYRPK